MPKPLNKPAVKTVVTNPKKPIVGGPWARIAPIGFSPNDGIKICLYGRSGTGKTTLWATFPGPILALVCSGGNKPGELRSVNTPENRDRIFQYVVNDSQDIFQIAKEQEQTKRFKTIVLDHCTGLQDLILKEILGLNEVPVQMEWGTATQQQWGQVGIKVKELLRQLMNLSCNVVFVAHERSFGDGAGDAELELVPTVGVALTPTAAGWLHSAADYVCETTIVNETKQTTTSIAGKSMIVNERTGKKLFALRTAPHNTYTTKFRLPKGRLLPEFIFDPTYEKITSLIMGR